MLPRLALNSWAPALQLSFHLSLPSSCDYRPVPWHLAKDSYYESSNVRWKLKTHNSRIKKYKHFKDSPVHLLCKLFCTVDPYTWVWTGWVHLCAYFFQSKAGEVTHISIHAWDVKLLCMEGQLEGQLFYIWVLHMGRFWYTCGPGTSPQRIQGMTVF